MIEVCVELQFNVSYHSNGESPPSEACVTVVNGTNAHDILAEASNQHPCYNFTTKDTSYGRMIESICNIQGNVTPEEMFYWSIYINGQLAQVGIDDLKPGQGSKLDFEYLNWGK